MNSFEDFASIALAWLSQTTLAAAVLALIALVLQAICGRWLTPRWTYALWVLVALRSILPVVPESPFSISNIYASPQLLPSEMPLAAVTLEQPILTNTAPIEHRRLSVPLLLVTLWIFGAASYFLVCFRQYVRLLSWARRRPPVTHPRVLAVFRQAQEQLGFHRRVTIIETQFMSVAAVLGVWRRYLLLPTRVIESWSDDELRFAILHELVHLRRRDNVLNWMLIFVQALHWFNPLVWFALRRLRAEREALCDTIVLSYLRVEERHSYGAALIKAAEQLASGRYSPALVPILNQKHEIHRRIRMITLFKPTRRLLTLLAGAAVLAIACVTFTGAAQKDKAKVTPPKAAPRPAPTSDSSLRTLHVQLEEIESDVRQQQDRVEQLRHDLRIPSHIANGDGSQPGPYNENLRKLEGLSIEAEAELQRITTLYEHLAAFKRPELRKVIQTAAPDQQLYLLFDRLADAEQKYASLSQLYANEHPEVKSMRRVLEKIDQQINDRLEGILDGLKARRNSVAAQAKQLKSDVAEYAQRDLLAATSYREYFNAKRELENLYRVRDRLHLRLLEERIDAALPGKSTETFNDSAPAAP